MDVNAHIWSMFMVLVIVLVGSFTWFFVSNDLKDNITTDSLNNAVKVALYDSVDRSSRAQPGVLYINVNHFEQDLRHTRIKDFDGNELSPKNSYVAILPDKYADNHKLMNSSDTYNSKNNNYVPIRGVEVLTRYDAGAKRNFTPQYPLGAKPTKKNFNDAAGAIGKLYTSTFLISVPFRSSNPNYNSEHHVRKYTSALNNPTTKDKNDVTNDIDAE